ncbi:hypothetical protein BJX99DRAFT_256392 [Aspergillus californicus]
MVSAVPFEQARPYERKPHKLPCELMDMILDYVEPTLPYPLVNEHWYTLLVKWYTLLVKSRVRHLQLSTRMVLNLSTLSSRFLIVINNHTRHISIDLRVPDRFSITQLPSWPVLRDNPVLEALNCALRKWAALIRSFRALESFSLDNQLDTEVCWTAVNSATFESLLSSISVHQLRFVRINMPGAPRENRAQLYQLEQSNPHACDMINRNFPNTGTFVLRMREICPDIFNTSAKVARLEKFIIRLDLEPDRCQELDLDASVVDCRHGERLGEDLVSAITHKAISFCRSSATPSLRELQFICWIGQDLEVPRRLQSYTICGNGEILRRAL